MGPNTSLGFLLPLAVGIAAIGSGLGLGKAVGAAMEAMGRQPEASSRIQTGMIIGRIYRGLDDLRAGRSHSNSR
jgi:F-type H+-transporting ATPase subunit c